MVFIKKDFPSMQTIKEEVANSITHGIGFVLSILAMIFLLHNSIIRGSVKHVVSSSIYGSTLLILYVISTLYHAITHQKAKKVFRRLDHISIYLLIAGTYMPIILVALQGGISWTLFGLVCGFAFVGILIKAIFGPRFEILSSLFYLLMGWIAMIAIKPMYVALSMAGFKWLMLGGLFYTLGIVFFATDKKFVYHHAIWHLFVLLGSLCHFFMVFYYVLPFSI